MHCIARIWILLLCWCTTKSAQQMVSARCLRLRSKFVYICWFILCWVIRWMVVSFLWIKNICSCCVNVVTWWYEEYCLTTCLCKRHDRRYTFVMFSFCFLQSYKLEWRKTWRNKTEIKEEKGWKHQSSTTFLEFLFFMRLIICLAEVVVMLYCKGKIVRTQWYTMVSIWAVIINIITYSSSSKQSG